MDIPFWKMHGAANDFILVDDRAQTFPASDRGWISAITRRRTGVGSDGIILIQPSRQADFRMRFFNPDGGEVEMCGNGARCVARLAHHLGAAPSVMRIETVAGLLHAEIQEERVLLRLTDPHSLRLNHGLLVRGERLVAHSVNTGVPHVVVETDDLERLDVQATGAAIRYHPDFAPAGTNANFVRFESGNRIRVRTYERGVEAETLACGTGIVACGVVAAALGLATSPVTVIPASGDALEVGFERSGDTFRNVTLLGPAAFVCRGVLEYPAA